MTRVAVVGHVEWVEFATVPHVPRAGEIVHADRTYALAAGGGAGAALGLLKLAGGATFLTALGDDALGDTAAAELTAKRLDVHATRRDDAPTRRCWTHVDRDGERAITVLGPRIAPRGADPLPWALLAGCDAVFFTAGDAAALRAARAARTLVLTRRALDTALAAQVPIDAIVSSTNDPGEQGDLSALLDPPAFVVATDGARGGRWTAADGTSGSWDAAPLPGPAVDSYGCGDAFAAGLTFGLAAGRGIQQAVELGGRCGAACLAGEGPDSWTLRP